VLGRNPAENLILVTTPGGMGSRRFDFDDATGPVHWVNAKKIAADILDRADALHYFGSALLTGLDA